MVRRTATELIETQERARAIYGKIGAHFTSRPNRVIMPGGGRLTFAYLDKDKDAENYQGASFSRVYVEEVGNFPSPAPILKLLATLRSGVGVPVGMRLTGNPGGSGHQWVKARYIDPAPRGWKVITDPETGSERIYLPSRIAQNKCLGEDYVRRLKESAHPNSSRRGSKATGMSSPGRSFRNFPPTGTSSRRANCPSTGRGSAHSTGDRRGRSRCTGGPCRTGLFQKSRAAR